MAEDQAEPELALEVQVRTNYLFMLRCTTTCHSVLIIYCCQVPWSSKILDGSKTIETRAYPLPIEYLHKPILLVESPPGGLATHGLDQVSHGALVDTDSITTSPSDTHSTQYNRQAEIGPPDRMGKAGTQAISPVCTTGPGGGCGRLLVLQSLYHTGRMGSRRS